MSDLLPPNASSAEIALAGAVSRVTDVPVPVRDVWDATACPSSMLPWLAWAFSVDQWDPAWTDDQKRATISASVSVHRYKGTIGAVRQAIAALGVDAQIQEWFNQSPPGDPYTYDVLLTIGQVGASLPVLQKMLDVIETSKNLRSHMLTLIPIVISESELFVGSASGIGSEVTVRFGGGGLVSNGAAASDGAHKSNSLG